MATPPRAGVASAPPACSPVAADAAAPPGDSLDLFAPPQASTPAGSPAHAAPIVEPIPTVPITPSSVDPTRIRALMFQTPTATWPARRGHAISPSVPRARQRLEHFNNFLSQADGTQWDTLDETDLALLEGLEQGSRRSPPGVSLLGEERPAQPAQHAQPATPLPSFGGFQTGAGSKIALSADQLARAQALLGEERPAQQATSPVPLQTPAPPPPLLTPASRGLARPLRTPASRGSNPGSGFKPPVQRMPSIVPLSRVAPQTAVQRSIEAAAQLAPPAEAALAEILKPGEMMRRRGANRIKLAQLERTAAGRSVAGQPSRDAAEVTCSSAASFRFRGFVPGHRFDFEGIAVAADAFGTVGCEAIELGFAASSTVPIPTRWVANHFRWAVWKLASMERAFAHAVGRCLTLERVVYDLAYRYDRELNLCHRPIIRKFLEGDDSPSRCMVLCVSSAPQVSMRSQCAASCDEEAVTPTKRARAAPPAVSATVGLTDGWYEICAQLDEPLARIAAAGRIRPGMKLLVWGAQLESDKQVTPLEAGDDISIRIFRNSTRPARWDMRLGLQARPVFAVPLDSLVAGGGMAPSLDVVVARKYPVLYSERLPDGSRVMRNEREEAAAVREWERQRELFAEASRRHAQSASSQESPNQHSTQSTQPPDPAARRRMPASDFARLGSGREIDEALKMTADPDSIVGSVLTHSQHELWSRFRQEKGLQEQDRLRSKQLRAQEASAVDFAPRDVSLVVRLRLVQYHAAAGLAKSAQGYILTVWRPAEDVLEHLREGDRVQISGVVVTRQTGPLVQLANSSKTVFRTAKLSDEERRRLFEPRCASSAAEMMQRACGSETDAVGMVVLARPKPSMSFFASAAVEVFLCDRDRRLWVLEVPKQLFDAQLQLFAPAQALAVANATIRAKDASNAVPVCETTESTQLLAAPRARHLQDALQELVAAAGERAAAVAALRELVECMDFRAAVDDANTDEEVAPEPAAPGPVAAPAVAPDAAPPTRVHAAFKPPGRTSPGVPPPAALLHRSLSAPQPPATPQPPPPPQACLDIFENFKSPYTFLATSPKLRRDFKKPSPTKATVNARFAAPTRVFTTVRVAAGDPELLPRAIVVDMTEGATEAGSAPDVIVACPLCDLNMTEIECIVHVETCGTSRGRRESLRKAGGKRMGSPQSQPRSQRRRVLEAASQGTPGQRASQAEPPAAACAHHRRHATEDTRKFHQHGGVQPRLRLVVTDGSFQRTVALTADLTLMFLAQLAEQCPSFTEYLEHFRDTGHIIWTPPEAAADSQEFVSQFSDADTGLAGRRMLVLARKAKLARLPALTVERTLRLLLAGLVVVDMTDVVDFVEVRHALVAPMYRPICRAASATRPSSSRC